MESNAKYTLSKLNFVDLAGSERLGKTQVNIESCASVQADLTVAEAVCAPVEIYQLIDFQYFKSYINTA